MLEVLIGLIGLAAGGAGGFLWARRSAAAAARAAPDPDPPRPLLSTPLPMEEPEPSAAAPPAVLESGPALAMQLDRTQEMQTLVDDPFTGTLFGPFDELGELGAGAMGQVLRVFDRRLQRSCALKVLLPERAQDDALMARFQVEAQVTAQLQHPGIVPVYQAGTTPDERHWFTMREFDGRTLNSLIRETWSHLPGRPRVARERRRQLLESFRKVCEAMAYAHARGVVHRDLKPDNIMVGAYGEVLVIDWGVAKVRDQDDLAGVSPVTSLNSAGVRLSLGGGQVEGSLKTQDGAITGTPAYMSPEQAQGQSQLASPASDVWALGAILFEILTGAMPFAGNSALAVMLNVIKGNRRPLESRLGVPDDLNRMVDRAMALDPAERYPDAGGLAVEMAAWLEGATARERALQLVETARALEPSIAQARERAAALQRQAGELLAALPRHASSAEKQPAWALEDEAERLERQADRARWEYLQGLREALYQDPELDDAHRRLAVWYRAEHERAESRGDTRAAAVAEAQLRVHQRGEHEDWLAGTGSLTLVTDPPGAEVELLQFVERGRRLVAERVVALGRTPLRRVELPIGSYLLVIQAPGRQRVRYPVRIERQRHWHGRPPGHDEAWPIYLPREGELGPDEIYVPAGWCLLGGDEKAVRGLPKSRVWIDGFAIGRLQISNRRYLEFLDALAAEGRPDEAYDHAPSTRSAGGAALTREPIMAPGPDGRFALQPDSEGDLWELDWPVLQVDWFGAAAYAQWRARATGLPFRLVGELEWEKAARGVDRRFFPMGDHIDPSWTCISGSLQGPPQPVAVHDLPEDLSPYGVMGMAGNAGSWTADVGLPEGPPIERGMPPVLTGDDALDHPALEKVQRVARGGHFFASTSQCRAGARRLGLPRTRNSSMSFRIARPIGPRWTGPETSTTTVDLAGVSRPDASIEDIGLVD